MENKMNTIEESVKKIYETLFKGQILENYIQKNSAFDIDKAKKLSTKFTIFKNMDYPVILHFNKELDLFNYNEFYTLMYFYDNCIYYDTRISTDIKFNLWELFKIKYLIPVIESIYSKITNYSIDFYKENPIEDCFNIAINRFIQNEENLIKEYLNKITCQVNRKSNHVRIEVIFDEPYKNINIHYGCNLKEIRTTFDKNFDKKIILYSFLRVTKYLFLEKYREEMLSPVSNIIKNMYMEVSNFHISNSISLAKYATHITSTIDNICHLNTSIFKCGGAIKNLTLCEDLPPSIKYVSFSDTLSSLNDVFDYIREISRVSDFKNIDTFVDLDNFYKYNDILKNIFTELVSISSSYKDKYLENGLNDRMLITTVHLDIWRRIQQYLDKLEMRKKNEYVYFVDEHSSPYTCNPPLNLVTTEYTKSILNEIKCDRYGENLSTLIEDTTGFMNNFYINYIKLIHVFIEVISNINIFVERKLYNNSVNELNHNVIQYAIDNINSNESISSLEMLCTSNTVKNILS